MTHCEVIKAGKKLSGYKKHIVVFKIKIMYPNSVGGGGRPYKGRAGSDHDILSGA